MLVCIVLMLMFLFVWSLPRLGGEALDATLRQSRSPGGYERFDLRRMLLFIRTSSGKLIRIVAWRHLAFFV